MNERSIVFATTNAGKVAELAELLGPSWVVKSALDFAQVGQIQETAVTFEGNAQLKARAFCEATGLLCVADDSGLCVDALEGRPGVHSARYAPTDAERNAKLLSELASIEAERRTAHFECALCAVWPDGRIEIAKGTCHGRIASEPRGDHGFGYDPVFELPTGQTLAQLTRSQKAQVSHRGAAFRALVTKLSL